MRVMDDVISEHGLAEELEGRMVEETGNTSCWFVEDTDMGEDSDQEDPEADAEQKVNTLLQESADKRNLVQAVQGALQSRAALTDLERARMQLEDLRAQEHQGCA